MLDLARDLEVKLPGTKAAFRAGTLRHAKVQIIAWATAMLDPEEARAAEDKVLGRAGRLTPGGLRSAIAQAVMQVAPEKARKRREDAQKDARVQRWAEDSGNAALAGGRSCLCNGGPKCRHDHRLKQHPQWKVEQITPATFRWTAPSGRSSTTEPTRYSI